MKYLTSDQYFQVLYHVLGVVPAYQASIGPALNELCLGLQADDVANVFIFLCYIVLYFWFCRVITYISFHVYRRSMEYIQKMFMSEWPA